MSQIPRNWLLIGAGAIFFIWAWPIRSKDGSDSYILYAIVAISLGYCLYVAFKLAMIIRNFFRKRREKREQIEAEKRRAQARDFDLWERYTKIATSFVPNFLSTKKHAEWQKAYSIAAERDRLELAGAQAYEVDVLRLEKAITSEFHNFTMQLALLPRPVTDPQHAITLFAAAFASLPLLRDPALQKYIHARSHTPLGSALGQYFDRNDPRPTLQNYVSQLPPEPEIRPIAEMTWQEENLWGPPSSWVRIEGVAQPGPRYEKNIPALALQDNVFFRALLKATAAGERANVRKYLPEKFDMSPYDMTIYDKQK